MVGTTHQAAQALLVEVTKTAAKYRAISAWATAVKAPGGDQNKNGSGGLKDARAGSARQDRAMLLRTQKVAKGATSGLLALAPTAKTLILSQHL